MGRLVLHGRPGSCEASRQRAVLHLPRSYMRAAAAPKLGTGGEAFDTAAYLTPHSDIVALMVLNHQTHMTNLLTRLGWQARIAAHDGPKAVALLAQMRDTAFELVDYLVVRGRGADSVAGKGRVRLYDRSFRQRARATRKGVRYANSISPGVCFAIPAAT